MTAGVALVACLAVSWPLTVLARRLALHHDVVDRPNARSSHTAPTPRGGGLAFVTVFLGAVLALAVTGDLDRALAAALFAGGVPIALIGLVDDLRSLSPAVRAVVHAGAVSVAVAIVGLPSEHSVLVTAAAAVLAVVGLVWLVNLYNFMDGIDGIAGAQAVIAGLALTALAWDAAEIAVAGAALAGAVAGFLLLNWPPARIFMGDVGSGFLGLAVGAVGLAAVTAADVPPLACLLVVAPFVVDATGTLLLRVVRRERWYEAHRDHLYQRLVQAGRTHRWVTTAYGTAAVATSTWAVWLAESTTWTTAGALAAYAVVTVVWWTCRSVGTRPAAEAPG